MTSALARFQDAFFEATLLPLDAPVPAHLRPLLDQRGFAVYRNTVLKGCVDALQANYPAVHALVGSDWFQAVAARYARAHPPQDSRMRVYGEGFANFLHDLLRNVATSDDLPYLPGVACLDRLWSEAHGAADAPVLAAAAVTALPLEALGEMVLVPHPAARWAWFDDQPIYTIWQRNRGDGDNRPKGNNSADELVWTGEGALLTRPTAAVTWTALDVAGCAFLDACAAGHPLAHAASEALARQASTDLAQLMAGLLNAGAFCSAHPCANQAINQAMNQAMNQEPA